MSDLDLDKIHARAVSAWRVLNRDGLGVPLPERPIADTLDDISLLLAEVRRLREQVGAALTIWRERGVAVRAHTGAHDCDCINCRMVRALGAEPAPAPADPPHAYRAGLSKPLTCLRCGIPQDRHPADPQGAP